MGAHSEDFAGFPAGIIEKVVLIDAELDELWPGWRAKRPFNMAPYETKARLKWLHKRRSLLMHTEAGEPCPLDWDVIVLRDGRDPNKCYAHPVLPVVTAAAEGTREPPSPLSGERLAALQSASRPVLSPLAALAEEVGCTEAIAEEALRDKPPGWMDTPAAWVRRAIAAPAPVRPGDGPGAEPRRPKRPRKAAQEVSP